LFTCNIENLLVIISINSGMGGVMLIGLVMDFGVLVKVALKGGWEIGDGGRDMGL
jgi:hypothetical protein